MPSKPKNISEALEELENFKNNAHEEIKRTKVKVEDQLQENPWATLGLVGLVCFVLGMIFAGRFSSSRKSD